MKILIISFLILGICGANAETPNTEKNTTFLMGKLSPTEMEKYEQTYVDNSNVSSYQKNGWLLYAVIGQGSSTKNLMIKKKSGIVFKKPDTKSKKTSSTDKKVNSGGESAESECEKKTPLRLEIAKVLCDGETSLNPLKCFKNARHGTDRAVAILCSGAKSLAPLYCFHSMRHGTNSEVAILCSGVTDANWKKRVACFYDNKKSGTHWKLIKQCATKGLDLIHIL